LVLLNRRGRKPTQSEATVSKMKRLVREHERKTGEGEEIGGTGFTVIKLKASPIVRLIDRGRIGGEEMRAAEEIATVFTAISGGLMFKPLTMERQDKGASPPDPAWLVDAQSRYRLFASHWSTRAKRGDPTLAILIAALIDERPFRHIEQDFNIRNGRAENVVVGALRDYAARSEWCDHKVAAAWLEAASSMFRLRACG
jgi:hypothetical protein